MEFNVVSFLGVFCFEKLGRNVCSGCVFPVVHGFSGLIRHVMVMC